MSGAPNLLSQRRARWAFITGCIAVTAGVLLHLPMFWMGRNMGFELAGMPMDPGMIWGMALIVAGIIVAGYGLLPRHMAGAEPPQVKVTPPEDAPLTLAHWLLMAALTMALVIDVMKPASLGFVVPGMVKEYQAPAHTVAWLPFSALAGTVLGSIVWGALADIYGRRAAILLSAVMFVGTAICGAMPSLWWNVAMCFLMGAAAGGMLPVTYALLAETFPSRHRGWVLVLVGGLGAAGGYLAASSLSAVLQPLFGWRIMWLLNLPTGLLLILFSVYIPESAKFLLRMGLVQQAHDTLRRFGSVVTALSDEQAAVLAPRRELAGPASAKSLAGVSWALSLTGLAWGLINFGLLLWMPAHLVAKGYTMGVSSGLLAASSLIALPTVLLTAFVYSRWSTKGALAVAIGVTVLGLAGLMWLNLSPSGQASPVLPVAMLIVGINAIIAIILPYTAESYPLRIRGRAAGWVSACTKAGGLLAQILSLTALVPDLGAAVLMVLIPVLIALVLVLRFCAETRGRDLRDLDGGEGAVLAGQSA
jgi:putative MFS transporter